MSFPFISKWCPLCGGTTVFLDQSSVDLHLSNSKSYAMQKIMNVVSLLHINRNVGMDKCNFKINLRIAESKSMCHLSLNCVCVCFATVMSDSVIPWTVAHWAPLSMGFTRQEHWSGLPFSSPGDLPNLGIKPRSPALQADSLPSEPTREALGS